MSHFTKNKIREQMMAEDDEDDDDVSEDTADSNVNKNHPVSSKGRTQRSRSSGNRRRSFDYSIDDDDDNFFMRDHQEHMRQMDQMLRSPFGSFGGGLLALPQATSSDRRRQQQQAQNMQMVERNMFADPFAHFGSMFSNMRSMMTDMHRAFDNVSSDPNAQVYQQQSFMSYSNTGKGAPKVYQASSSSRQGPGGVRETRKAVRDSETGVEKISVGHHINDRGHVIERGRNHKTGEESENQEYLNLDEGEAQPFDQEYREKWHNSARSIEARRRGDRPRHASIGESPYHRARHAALPEPPRNRKSSNSSRKE